MKSKYLSTITRSPYTSTSPKLIYYYYDCCAGNNGAMVRKILAGRSWWKDRNVYKSYKPTPNLTWTMGIGGYNYDALTAEVGGDPMNSRCINRYQNGFEINDKDNLFRNLWHYFKDDRTKVMEVAPLTFSFRSGEA